MMEEKEELVKCPCCGKLTLQKPVKVKQSDLDLFLASTVTGVPYSKTYKLYKGAVAVTVAAVDEPAQDKMNILTTRMSIEEPDEDLKEIQQLFVIRLYTLLPIISIKILNPDPIEKDVRAITLPLLQDALSNVKNKEWLQKAYERLCDPALVGALPKAVLNKVVAKHLQNCALLTESGFDQDFFMGIVQD